MIVLGLELVNNAAVYEKSISIDHEISRALHVTIPVGILLL